MDNINILNMIFYVYFMNPLIFAFNSLTALLVSALVVFAKRPQVTIVSIPTGEVGLGALLACKLAGVKYVVDYRDEWEAHLVSLTCSRIEKFIYSAVKKIMASLYAHSCFIVAVTPGLVSSLKCLGVTSARLIPNGADTGTFKPLANKKSMDFVLFYSGGIGGYYRLDLVVRALKTLVDKGLRNVKLVIAGYGEVEDVLNLALRLGISSNVKYEGTINNKAKLAELTAKADVGFVPFDDNPLWKNALPAKFFEYCACGIPVIATVYEDSILSKLIRKHRVGLTVPPMHEEELAEAIYQIYENKAFRKVAGKRARLLIEEKFERHKISNRFLGLVEQVVQS